MNSFNKINTTEVWKAIEYHEKREENRKEFYDKRKYIDLIDGFIELDSNSDDYNEPSQWTDEIDDMFSFLYRNANEITPFHNGEVVIEYGDKYASLFEMYGQGTFRSICPIKEKCTNYVKFDDIVFFYETGEKPLKSKVLEIVNRSLNMLEIAIEGIDIPNLMSIDEVREYIEDNLK